MSELTREGVRNELHHIYLGDGSIDTVVAHDAALRAKVEAYKKGYEDQVALKDRYEAGYRETIAQLQDQLTTLTAERDRLKEALKKIDEYMSVRYNADHPANVVLEAALRGEGG